MHDFNDQPISASADFLTRNAVSADHSASAARDDEDLPLDTDYWICTCGHENEGTDRCEECHGHLHERDWYWDSFRR